MSIILDKYNAPIIKNLKEQCDSSSVRLKTKKKINKIINICIYYRELVLIGERDAL